MFSVKPETTGTSASSKFGPSKVVLVDHLKKWQDPPFAFTLYRVLLHPGGVSSFLPIANKFTTRKRDAIATVQAATIILSPNIVTFAVLLKEVRFMGRAMSHDKSPICLLRSGHAH